MRRFNIACIQSFTKRPKGTVVEPKYGFGFLGGVAVALATTNVFGGFDITNKMLKMIAGSGKKRG